MLLLCACSVLSAFFFQFKPETTGIGLSSCEPSGPLRERTQPRNHQLLSVEGSSLPLRVVYEQEDWGSRHQ